MFMSGANIPRWAALGLLTAFVVFATSGCGRGESEKPKVTRVITLDSDPQGASVTIDGRPLKGKTPTRLSLPKGGYLFEFSMPGYQSQWVKRVCVEPAVTVKATLKPIAASVLIDSKPSRAAVIISGKRIGETPMVLRDLPLGKGSAIVQKAGHAPKEVTWELTDNRPKRVFAELNSTIGELMVESDPEGADILINGEMAGKTPLANPLNLAEGQYKVQLLLEGYSSFEDTVTVGRGKVAEVKGALHLLPGSLKIQVTPIEATLSLTGPNGVTKALGSGDAVLKQLKPGEYTLKAECPPDFDNETVSFAITPGKRETVKINLQGNTGGLDIIANPPGVTIYLDGKKLGRSKPDKVDPKRAAVFPVRNLTSGKHTVMVAHKNAIPKSQSMKVYVRKRQVTRLDPINLWVRDTYVKLTNGEEIRGRLLRENAREVYIQREPNITQGFPRSDIKVKREIINYDDAAE